MHTEQKMRILQVHNRYIWSPGGEIAVLDAEAQNLRDHGHVVEQFFVDNAPDDNVGLVNKVKTARKIIWSAEGLNQVRKAIQKYSPDIVHCHNFFAHLSPSIYKACNLEGVPIVQTLHNFRTCCAAANLMRDNHTCQDCVGKFPIPALKHKCYRGSLMATVPIVAMQQVNRWNGSFTSRCDGYIALSQFAKEIFTRSGLPNNRIHVKGHSTIDAGFKPVQRKKKVVFVGRFVEDKGAEVLIEAWKNSMPADWELHLLGTGPLEEEHKAQAAGDPSIHFLGWLEQEQAQEAIRESYFLVNSSHCYESFGLTLIEAMAVGTIPIVPAHGQMPEIAECNTIGLSFKPSDAMALREVLKTALAMPETEFSERSRLGRQRYEENYTPEINYKAMIQIYQVVRAEALKNGHCRA